MKPITLTVLLFLFLLGSASAQPLVVSVDINSARLTWNHDLVGVDEFRVDCGGTIPHVVPAPVLEAPLVDFIITPGTYTCNVKAANQFGELSPSNNVTFNTGVVPTAPINFKLVSP